ncbi:MAG: TolC family protein, partial [Calditrichaeota bacterium]|nr:TolC family protein [Calditrichota bacterium]
MRRFHWLCALVLCPFIAWGAEIRSLSLDQAIQIALDRNRSLKVAKARLKSSHYGAREARSAFLPHLAAKASYTRLDQRPYIAPSNFDRMFEPLIVPFADLVANGYLNPATLAGLQSAGIDRIYTGREDYYDLNLSVEQPLFTGGAIRNSYEIAKLNAETELWNYRRDEEEVRYDVTQTFLNLVKARELVRVTDESIGRSQVHLTDLENLRAQGLAIERDLLRARVALSNARLQNIHAQNAAKLAASRLCHLLALDLDTELAPAPVSGLEPDSLVAQEVYMVQA